MKKTKIALIASILICIGLYLYLLYENVNAEVPVWSVIPWMFGALFAELKNYKDLK